MTILVTGACGWIGRQVCSFLHNSGVSVIAADLKQSSGPWSQFLPLDISKPILSDSSGVWGVIHCAGVAHRPNESMADRDLFYAVNRDGTGHVLDWCQRNGVKRFLYIGSIAAYDWEAAAGMPVAEDRSLRLESHYARSKHEGELLVQESALDWRAVRLATVFGEGDPANFSRMVQAMKKRLFFVPGKGGARKSVIPVSLAAELISQFALMDHPPHRLLNLALPDAPSLAEICDSFHRVCGVPSCFCIPMPVAKGLGWCGDLVARRTGQFPFTSDTLRKLTVSTRVSVDRMLECFPERRFGSFSDYLSECSQYYRGL